MINPAFTALTAEIAAYEAKLTPKEAAKYRIALLGRVVERTAGFSPDCEECRASDAQLKLVVDSLAKSPVTPQALKAYRKGIDRRVLHLRKVHKLASDGENTSLFIGIGVALGLAVSTLLNAQPVYSVAIGMAIGLVVGGAAGMWLDARARKQGRVI